jgi:hypothetical protein
MKNKTTQGLSNKKILSFLKQDSLSFASSLYRSVCIMKDLQTRHKPIISTEARTTTDLDLIMSANVFTICTSYIYRLDLHSSLENSTTH